MTSFNQKSLCQLFTVSAEIFIEYLIATKRTLPIKYSNQCKQKLKSVCLKDFFNTSLERESQ